MKINFDKMVGITDRITDIKKTLRHSQESVNHARQLIGDNKMLEQTEYQLKKVSDEIDSQIVTLQRLMLSVDKIKSIYISAEQRIESTIEGDITDKRDFVRMVRIKTDTNFSWRIV